MLPFTKITEGADAGKWKATVRLLGVTGTEQLLTGEIRYADGNPTPTTLKSDLTEALAAFNTGKGESLTLGGTLVETPNDRYNEDKIFCTCGARPRTGSLQ